MDAVCQTPFQKNECHISTPPKEADRKPRRAEGDSQNDSQSPSPAQEINHEIEPDQEDAEMNSSKSNSQ